MIFRSDYENRCTKRIQRTVVIGLVSRKSVWKYAVNISVPVFNLLISSIMYCVIDMLVSVYHVILKSSHRSL